MSLVISSQNLDANTSWRSFTTAACEERFRQLYGGILGIPAMTLAHSSGRNCRILTAFPRFGLLDASLQLDILEVIEKDGYKGVNKIT